MIDLAVVGGGPVGLVTALEAARSGLRVTVLDARAGDGDKACGEGLMPSAVAALSDLGVDPPGMPIAGIAYLRRRRRAEARFDGPPGRGVRRTALAASLRSRIAQAGVEVRDSTVRTLAPIPGGLRVSSIDPRARATADGKVDIEVDARYVAVADGLHSPMRRTLGLRARSRGPARYGLRQHFAVAPWTDCVEVHWADDAEAYVTPVASDAVGVAVLGPGGASFAERMRSFPELAERLADAEPCSRVRGAGPLRQSASARVSGRAMLVGDAAGYVDALTGEGMALGFAAARELVRCVLDDDPERYEAAWTHVTWRPRWVTEALLAATRLGPVRRGLVPAAQRAPWAFSTAVHVLA